MAPAMEATAMEPPSMEPPVKSTVKEEAAVKHAYTTEGDVETGIPTSIPRARIGRRLLTAQSASGMKAA